MERDEFYIGYLPKAPPGLAAFTRNVAAALLAAGALIAALLVVGQQPFDPGVFEFLQYRDFEGVVGETPYPTLRLRRPGTADDPAAYSRYYLVTEGKHGAQTEIRGLEGQPVRLQGSLIYRDDQTMVEIVPGTVKPSGEAAQVPPATGGRSLGTFTLTGEIVDAKCFLGVMHPGSLKPHRACAARCISGGIPPVLAVRDASGRTAYLMLVSKEGRAVNHQVLDKVAEPVTVTGEAVRHDDLLVLRADPSTYRRLSE